MNEDEEELVDRYLAYLDTRKDEYFSAWDDLESLIRDGQAERAWVVIRTLIERADERHMELIGAGPLEGFFGNLSARLADGDDDLLQEVEELARHSVRCRRALLVMYPGPDEGEIWRRIDAILGTSVHERHPIRNPLD